MALIVEFSIQHMLEIVIVYLSLVAIATWGLKRETAIVSAVSCALALPFTVLMWIGMVGQIVRYTRQIWP